MTLRRAAIVAPIRTAVGKFGGSLSALTAGELGLLDAQGGTLLAAGPAIRFTGTWALDPAQAGRRELLTTPGGAGTIRLPSRGAVACAGAATTCRMPSP